MIQVRMGEGYFHQTRPMSRLEKEDEIARCEAAAERLRENDERLGPDLDPRGSLHRITDRSPLPENCE